jgi:alginate O-acetyltransferase complex protein AlgI
MLFHSQDFLELYVVAFVGYWLLRGQRLRLGWILLASLAFYAAWNPWLLPLILLVAALGYSVARGIDASPSPERRRRLVILGITASLGILGFFKYTNFFFGSVQAVLGPLGEGGAPRWFDIVLPLGISFYTFETICYMVDVYRGNTRAERSFVDYATFITFFPHLIAGPIVRPRQFFPQIRQAARLDADQLYLGLRYFLQGLVKKAVIADRMAPIVDPIFADPEAYGSGAVWVAVLCYAVQIYCDFSGYTDMAIGCAHGFGIRLPENFRMPYFATSPADFWRRWHITFSNWLRDYLYIPLGAARRGSARASLNLFLTMLLGGLWHGAAWTFVFWGAYQGALLVLHRTIPWPAWTGHRAWHPLKVAGTFLLTCIGWVFFRSPDFGSAGTMLARMFVPTSGLGLAPQVAQLAAVVIGFVFAAHLVGTFADVKRIERALPAPVAALLCALVLLLAQLLTPEEGGAFIYFQF